MRDESADEQHAPDRRHLQPGALHRAAQRGDGVVETRAHHRLELATRQPHAGGEAGNGNRDRGVGVLGEGFLGAHALVAEHGEGLADIGLGAVELGELPVEGGLDVREHRLVEIDAAEALDAVGGAEHLEAVVVEADHRGIEGAAPEVVDGDGVAGVELPDRRVPAGRRTRFGDQLDRVEPGDLGRRAQDVELEVAPRRGCVSCTVSGGPPISAVAMPTTWASSAPCNASAP